MYKYNKIDIKSMGKVILFIMKDIIVQKYTLLRIGNTFITSLVHIFIIYLQGWKFFFKLINLV